MSMRFWKVTTLALVSPGTMPLKSVLWWTRLLFTVQHHGLLLQQPRPLACAELIKFHLSMWEPPKPQLILYKSLFQRPSLSCSTTPFTLSMLLSAHCRNSLSKTCLLDFLLMVAHHLQIQAQVARQSLCPQVELSYPTHLIWRWSFSTIRYSLSQE